MKRLAGMWIVFLSVAALTATAGPAAALTWTWSYSGAGISAAGTFTTVDTPDPSGFYLITAIAGERNGAAIVALQPTGTPIPGNEPFAVDNLVKVDSPQLTTHGFGFAIAGGTFSNRFFASFLQPPIYLEFFSAPPSTSELPIAFSATPTPLPEMATWVLLLSGLGVLGLATRWRRHWWEQAARRRRAVSSIAEVQSRHRA